MERSEETGIVVLSVEDAPQAPSKRVDTIGILLYIKQEVLVENLLFYMLLFCFFVFWRIASVFHHLFHQVALE